MSKSSRILFSRVMKRFCKKTLPVCTLFRPEKLQCVINGQHSPGWGRIKPSISSCCSLVLLGTLASTVRKLGRKLFVLHSVCRYWNILHAVCKRVYPSCFFPFCMFSGTAVFSPSSSPEKYAVALDPQLMRRVFKIGPSMKDYMCAVLGVEKREGEDVELIEAPLGEHGIADSPKCN